MNAKLWKLGARPLILLGALAVIIGSSTNTSPGQGCYLVQPGGLIAWYKGEGNAQDSAGAHPGTLVNGVSFAPGKVGLGFDLNGFDSYVALSPNLFPYPTSGSGNAPFSFELWFSTLDGGVILGQQNTTPFASPSGYVPALYVGTDGRLYVAMFWDGFAQISLAKVNDGIFHHVAVTYDGTTER